MQRSEWKQNSPLFDVLVRPVSEGSSAQYLKDDLHASVWTGKKVDAEFGTQNAVLCDMQVSRRSTVGRKNTRGDTATKPAETTIDTREQLAAANVENTFRRGCQLTKENRICDRANRQVPGSQNWRKLEDLWAETVPRKNVCTTHAYYNKRTRLENVDFCCTRSAAGLLRSNLGSSSEVFAVRTRRQVICSIHRKPTNPRSNRQICLRRLLRALEPASWLPKQVWGGHSTVLPKDLPIVQECRTRNR